MSLTNYFSNLFSNFTGSGQLERENRRKYKIAPDKNAHDPDKAWDLMKRRQKSEVIEPLSNDTPIHPDKVRFVCISDTHSRVEKSRELVIPDGDVLLHAGDLTMYGEPEAVQMVNEYLGSLPHTHKVMIAGNHEMTFDLDLVNRKTFKISPWSLDRDHTKKELARLGVNTVHELLTNCIYLQDAMVQLYGIKIYGSPWTAGHGGWGFQVMRGAPLMSKWDKIPDDTDILITHCPPVGYGDSVMKETFKYKKALNKLYMLGDHVGCVDLLNTIQRRVQPKYSVFGHIHQGYGMYTDGTTTFVNASTCTESYIPTNKPIIFDIPLPDGFSKKISKEEAVKWIIPNKIGHSTEDQDYDIVFDDECSGTRLDECGTLNSDENGQEILDEAGITKSDEIEGQTRAKGAIDKQQKADKEIGEGVGSDTGMDEAESDAVGGELHGTGDSVAGKENQ